MAQHLPRLRFARLVALAVATATCSPPTPPPPPPPPVALALGGDTSFAVLSDSGVITWGRDLLTVSDQTIGPPRAFYAPVRSPLLSGFTGIAVGGSDFACALAGDGTVRCWGTNTYGQLGDESQTARAIPMLALGITGVTQVTAGAAHTCARRVDGTVWCWGANGSGQLGEDPTRSDACGAGKGGANVPCRRHAMQVVALAGVGALDAGGNTTCALITDGGAVWCFGDDQRGQLGDGAFGGARWVPRPVVTVGAATRVEVGAEFACALIADGTVRCWGRNDAGALGDGTLVDRAVPVAVVGLAGVTDITAGGSHACALLMDGTVRCWGANAYGQLGDGTRALHTTTVAVAGLADVVEVRAGRDHTCARLRDGGLRCWGRNAYDQVGDGSQLDRYAPVVVNGFVSADGDAAVAR